MKTRPTYFKGYEARNKAALLVLIPDHVGADPARYAGQIIPIKHVLGQRGFDGKVSGRAELVAESIGEDSLRVVLLAGSVIEDKPVRLVDGYLLKQD